ncbi:hypothetical protein Ddye_004679 [Dipteronia dyeriana]|uniref:Serine-threonine/tyrosine-protein kinase catalytic domain-containing protein n=1 Tax=Dipteronia dyeriana TaxID=168575 RepID=A0AAD9XFA8_9ROSI|nr:hypothetical protein Ddye_004679 [Dipteronia dyeriana]
MASMSSAIFFITISLLVSSLLSATLVEDLNNLRPPPDFNTTIFNNCLNNPSLKYCNSSPMDLNEIFKSTIVASHLCNESKNPNCVESFPKIDLRSRPKITPLYLSFNFFWKYCPLTIVSVDLSNNSLKGSFPSDVLLCNQLQNLDLSFNHFSGDIPLLNFSHLSNLTHLNLSYNHFSELKISDSNLFQRFNSSSFVHSGLLPSHQNYNIKTIILLVGFLLFVALIVVCLGWLCFARPDFLPRVLNRNHKFTTCMLKAATDGFSKKNLVTKSNGVSVYKGVLRDGTKVKIEIYRDNVSRENLRKFAEECKLLVQMRHTNLVRILGWCLVTEWTDGENIELWLAGSAPSWKHILKILIGVVESTLYMQEQWSQVGYDLSTSSVLLSDNLEPLISRLKIGDHLSNYTANGIYKFGLFLLEMMANRRPSEEFEQGEAGFIEYIRMHYPGNLRTVIDERMKLTQNTFDRAKLGIGLGLMCTDQKAGKIPSLDEIYHMIVKVYRSCLVFTSENYKGTHSHCSVGQGHKGIQLR